MVFVFLAASLAAQSEYQRKTQEIADRNARDQGQQVRSSAADTQRKIDESAKALGAAVAKQAATLRDGQKKSHDDVKSVVLDSAAKAQSDSDAHAVEANKASIETKAQVAVLGERLKQAQDAAWWHIVELMIAGGFGFLGLLVPVLAIFATRYKDHQTVMDKIALAEAEAHLAAQTAQASALESKASDKVINAKVDQIHTLVNSKLTQAKQDQLDARRDYLAVLKANAAAKGGKPSSDAVALMASVELKIKELEVQVQHRQLQTDNSSQQLAADLADTKT